MERYLRVNLLGPGPRLMKKRIYRALVSQRLRNTAIVGLDVFGVEENFLPRPEFEVIPARSLVAVPTTLPQPQSVLNAA